MEPIVGARKLFCNCSKYCGNPPKQVSTSTYNRHAKHRDADSFTPTFHQFLLQETQNAQNSSSSKRPHVSGDGSHPKRLKKGKERQDEQTEALEGTEDPDYFAYDPVLVAPQGGGIPAVLPLPSESDVSSSQISNTEKFPPISSENRDRDDQLDPGSLEDEQNSHSETPDGHGSGEGPLCDGSEQAEPIPLEEPDVEDQANTFQMEEVEKTVELIGAIKNARLGDMYDGLDEDFIDRLRNPPEEPLLLEDPDLRLSIDVYLSITNASQDTYNSTRKSILRQYPESKMLSLDQVKRRVAELSGVIPIVHDMCINSCLAYTGPWADLEECPKCNEGRYNCQGEKVIARQRFYTIPIGPQLQALWRSPQGAQSLRYREQRTKELLAELEVNDGEISVYNDILCGSDYLTQVLEGNIKDDDMVLMLSIDGAQLYKNKASDTWIYIWVVVDHAPNMRYKKRHVLPGGFIPGPNAPKILDSFLFPGLHHLSAIQNEGLRIWDAFGQRIFTSDVFLLLISADVIGMAAISGLVGHHGKNGCRIYCPLSGRHKRGLPHYYPACLKPDNYAITGCAHGDVPVTGIKGSSPEKYIQNLRFLRSACNKTQFESHRRETGICKPTIFAGIQHRLRVPMGFCLDVMHLPALNIPDLMINLWRGKFDCDKDDDKTTWDWAVLTGQVWKEHGKVVGDTTPYLPGSFDRPPRNPAEKINSGYKAWEFLLYLFGLGPGVFYNVLPEKYWRHFCKLVHGVRIISQKTISASELRAAHVSLLEFVDQFERLYYQRKQERLHFVRPSVHTLCHLAPEVARVGPGICSSQWTMERTIGNLAEEVKQHSNPFINLSQCGLRRSQVNALKAMIPDLEPSDALLPRGSIDLGNDYVLLRAMDSTMRPVRPPEAAAIHQYLQAAGIAHNEDLFANVVRWARLRLPNGQVARSAWKEKPKSLGKVRIARNVKLRYDNKLTFGEVLFYFRLNLNDATHTLAMVSLFSLPDPTLLAASSHTLWSCKSQGDAGLVVLCVKDILSVVAMIPHRPIIVGQLVEDRYFVVEKPGLDVTDMGGVQQELIDE